MWSAEKSSGDEGELRRMGLSFPKTSGLISRPMTLAGNGARLGLMTPIAISMPEVQCARVWAGHTTPLPLTVRTQLHDALLCVFYQGGVKEVFHDSCFCKLIVVVNPNSFLSCARSASGRFLLKNADAIGGRSLAIPARLISLRGCHPLANRPARIGCRRERAPA